MAQRIAIIGTSGAGKTTLGRELARRIGGDFIGVDALAHKANWVNTTDEELCAGIDAAIVGTDQWVIDGTFRRRLGDFVTARTDLIVWLDLPLTTILPRLLRRTDYGVPRILPPAELERYCELIAALNVRMRNTQRRHLSTPEAIRLFEDYGIDAPEGRVVAPKSLLKKRTVNRYLARWGYDQRTLAIQQPVVHFQASYANECWQFDVSPSDLKALPEPPPWIDARRGHPVLMLYSVVDDRSGVAYREYHVVYGEDVPAALRFLFRAMVPKTIEGFLFRGRPHVLYLDHGPIAKSQLFHRVMRYLDVEVRCHMPRGQGGRRVTSRAKGKVERPFRTVKEGHETLYHFHTPQHEEEANTWLVNFLLRYNEQPHRAEPHSRIEDWLTNLSPTRIRQMCTWERFGTVAREPERRTVGSDAQVSVHGTRYQVDEELIGQEVILWWGLFDDKIFVEHERCKYGPYRRMGGPIPFDRDQAFRKTPAERWGERVETLAATLALPREALTTDPKAPEALRRRLPEGVPVRAFHDPDPFNELMFPSVLAAKRAIAQSLEVPPREAEPTRARGDRRHCAADSMGAAIRGRHPCHFHLDSLLPP